MIRKLTRVLLLLQLIVSTVPENCSKSLGVAHNGYLPRSAFTASSESRSYNASQGRLGNPLNAWIPLDFQPTNKINEYLQVDLGKIKSISGVSVQGLTSGQFYVTRFSLGFSNDGEIFNQYIHAKLIKSFKGNANSKSTSTETFPCQVAARYIRFKPTVYIKGIAMKVDVLGCDTVESKATHIERFRVSNVGINSLSLLFEQTSDQIEHIIVSFFPVGQPDKMPAYPIQLQQKPVPIPYVHKINGLLSCMKYRVFVRIYDRIGCGIPEVHKITTTTRRSRPIRPSNFYGDNSIPEMVMLSWEKSQPGYQCVGDINGFKIFYKVQYSSEPYQEIFIPRYMEKYNLTNLISWRKYDIKIAASSNFGLSDLASLPTAIDVDGKPPEVPPVITQLLSNKPYTISVTWKDPPPDKTNGPISGYSIFYRLKNTTDENKWVHVGLTRGNKTSAQISLKVGWKQYQVYVSLYNYKHDISSEIKDVLVKGEKPGASPNGVQVSGVTSTSIQIKWDPIPETYYSPYLDGYVVNYGLSATTMLLVTTTNSTEILTTNLQEGRKYYFKVAGKSNGKVGPFSKTINQVTSTGPLKPPVITVIESNTPATCYIQWTIDPLTIVSTFVVHYKKSRILDTWITKDVGVVRNTTMKNLEEWIQYDFQVELVSLGRSNGSNALPVLIKGKTPGKAPSKVTVTNKRYTFISFSWNVINPRYLHKNVIEYGVQCYSNGDSNSNQMNRTRYRNITFTNLTHNTLYTFRVAGISEDGVGVFSKDLETMTKRIVPPEPPQFTITDNTNPTYVILKWFTSGGNKDDITSFVISLNDLSGGKKNLTKIYDAKAGLFSEIVNVAPFNSYSVFMKSCIIDVCGITSPPQYFKSPEDAPSIVQNLTNSVLEDSVILRWQRPIEVPGILRKFVIDVKTDKFGTSANKYPKNIENTTFEFVLDDLPSFKDYAAQVEAVTTLPGPPSVTLFKSPEGVPSKPLKVKAVLIKPDLMSVKWEKPSLPNGIIKTYKVTYEGSKYYDTLFVHKNSVVINAQDNHLIRIPKLVPGTRYKVKVFAATSRGFGDPEEANSMVETKVADPQPPPSPSIVQSEVRSSTISIYLKPAKALYGPIHSYQVIIEILNGPEPTDTKSTNTIDNSEDVTRLRNKRNIVKPTLPKEFYGYDKAMSLQMDFYITADILGNQIPAKFTVGDGKVYQGYKNQPLDAQSYYKLHIRTTTKDGSDMYFSPLKSIALPQTGKLDDDPSTTKDLIPILVGIAVALIVFVIATICLLKYIKSRRREPNQFEIGLVEVKPKDEAAERPVSFTNYPTHPDHPPIPISIFPKHVAKLHRSENNGFKTEYEQLEIGKGYAWDVAHLQENKPKNRYANIVAYDHSRVILSQCNGADYINASYIDGYRQPNAYIATQGPLPCTFNDFWRMIWEVRSTVVVMLTNLQEKNRVKCHKYWPDENAEYGTIDVTLLRKVSFASYVIRTFKLERVGKHKNGPGEVREVKQFHFTMWPDHGVPGYPTELLNFRKKVKSYELPDSGPVIIHCSAGVGRTGAYLVLDCMLDRLQHRNDVDVFNCIASMRTRRIAIVQTEDQYVFVYDAIVEAILVGNTLIKKPLLKESIKKLDQIEMDSKVSGFEKQWKTLNHANPILPKTDFGTASQYENTHKNRYSTVLPSDSNRVLLLPIDDNESTTYINAVYVDGFRRRNAFILTQSPLPKTTNDFWRMVCEHGSATVVMLNSVDEGDDYSQFWPDCGTHEYDMINVECLPESSKKEQYEAFSQMKPIYRTTCNEITEKNFQVTDIRNPSHTFQLKLFQYVGWTETRVPNSCKAIINLLTRIDRWQEQCGYDGPITIMCSDGLGRSGALAAVIYVLERLKVDHEFDAFQAIKSMRIQRPHVVKYMDQYKYIHSVVQECLNAFDDSRC